MGISEAIGSMRRDHAAGSDQETGIEDGLEGDGMHSTAFVISRTMEDT